MKRSTGVDTQGTARAAGAAAGPLGNQTPARTARETDRTLSDSDKTTSATDQSIADDDQRASDRDQRTADRDRGSGPLTPADESAYETARDERAAGSLRRLGNQRQRASTARKREETARVRDRVVALQAPRGTGHLGPEKPMNDGSTKKLLLVVEDNPGDVRLLREMFDENASHSTEVAHVASMSAAEKHLAEHTVDAILLDLGLPDAQGLDAVRRARAAAPGVPLVVLTGLDDEVLATQALKAGAEDYLVKGQIEARGLLRALRYAIERKLMDDARRAAETQLLQGEKLESIGRLAGGIAHDFNNMLFAIHGYAALLTQDLVALDLAPPDQADVLSSVTAITEAAERASALTGQLLSFSRRQIVSPVVLDVNAAVTAIEPMLNQLIGAQTQLILKLDPAAGNIRADGGQIDQIVVNLVVNARDAMPDGGTVTIASGRAALNEASEDGHEVVTLRSYVLLEVSDTGIGMDAITREHIFEPFFTTKDVGKGTGLGLATTYGIVHQAGGQIRVDSEPGHGSNIRLYFPRVDAAVEEPLAVPPVNGGGVGRVLIVEDDAAIRELLTKVLDRAGYEVEAVADGIEALASIRLGEPIDVLVTDVVMPSMSGIELARQMMDNHPLLGVVILSGHTAEALDLERVSAAGARFLAKPVTQTDLLDAVLRATAVRRGAAEGVSLSGRNSSA